MSLVCFVTQVLSTLRSPAFGARKESESSALRLCRPAFGRPPFRERLIDFLIAQGIELEFKESIAPALGMSYGGRIAILPGQAATEESSNPP
jgi:hypothetical protein